MVITPRPDPLGGEAYAGVKALAKVLFQHRRKTLGACLKIVDPDGSWASRLLAAGLDAGMRVDDLGLPALLRLSR